MENKETSLDLDAVNMVEAERKFEGILHRTFAVQRAEENEDGSVEIAFSSEQPVERWFGMEILSHDASAVNLERLNTGGAVLVNHDSRDQVGVVVDASARIDKDKIGRCSVRFSKSVRGQEIMQDVKDGIRRLVSVGYSIDKYETEERKGELPVITATSWTPHEVSFVPVPADQTVGVGRSKKIEQAEKPETKTERKEEMKDNTNPEIDVQAEKNEAKIAERKRVQAIGKVKEQFRGNSKIAEICDKAIADGDDAGETGLRALEAVGQAGKIDQTSPEKTDPNHVGMSSKEVARYSVGKAIRDIMEFGHVRGLEGEVQAELAKRHQGARGNAFYIPREVQTRATMVTTTGSLGGYLVQDENVGFIDLLRNKTLIRSLGASVLSGLKGNVSIPKQATASTAYWVAENVALTQSNPTLGQLALSPKTIGGNVPISRLLAMQSDPSAEALIMNDIAKVLAVGIDLAAINGSGTNGEPTGIINTTGVGSNSTASVTWAKMLGFEGDVSTANADAGTLAFLTTPSVRQTLKGTEKATGTAQFIWAGNQIDGYRAEVTNQVPAAHIIFGDFSQLIIAEWGTTELQVITQGTNYKAGEIEIQAFHSVDMGVRQPGAFSVSTDFS